MTKPQDLDALFRDMEQVCLIAKHVADELKRANRAIGDAIEAIDSGYPDEAREVLDEALDGPCAN